MSIEPAGYQDSQSNMKEDDDIKTGILTAADINNVIGTLTSTENNDININDNTTLSIAQQLLTLAPANTTPLTSNTLEAGTVEVQDSNGFILQFSAILASHGWVAMGPEQTKLPYVVRGTGQRLLPLCVVEKTFLAAYPGPYPEKELGRAPMMGFYLTTEEVRLLNRFVNQTYTQRYSLCRFSLKDMLVAVPDFIDFYHRVSTMVPYTPTVVKTPLTDDQPSVTGGWSQVNNTIVPYVLRNRVKMVPLSVVRYASGLLNEVEVPSLDANKDECEYLNGVCSEVGLDFKFEGDTKMIELFLVPTLSNQRVSINELPKKDPLQHARFVNRNTDRRSVFVAASVRTQEMTKRKPTKARAPKTPIKQPPLLIGKPTTPPSPTSVMSPGSDKSTSLSPSILPRPPPLVKQTLAPAPSPVIAPAPIPRPMMIRLPILTPSVSQTGPIAQPMPVIPAHQQIIVQPPAPGVKVCPQHGIRTMLVRQPIMQPGQMMMSPPGLQPVTMRPLSPNSTLAHAQRQPVMIIRLDRPIPPGAPLPMVLPPNMMSPIIIQSPVMPTFVKHEPVIKQEPVDNGPPVVIKIESDDEDDESNHGDLKHTQDATDQKSSILTESSIKTEQLDYVTEHPIRPDSGVGSEEQLYRDNNNSTCDDKDGSNAQIDTADIYSVHSDSAVLDERSGLLCELSPTASTHELDNGEDEGHSPSKRPRIDSTGSYASSEQSHDVGIESRDDNESRDNKNSGDAAVEMKQNVGSVKSDGSSTLSCSSPEPIDTNTVEDSIVTIDTES